MMTLIIIYHMDIGYSIKDLKYLIDNNIFE